MEYIAQFEDAEEAKLFAIKFSLENDIVNSPLWANCIIENAQDGAPIGHPGYKFTDQQIQKISESSKKMWSNPEYKARLKKVHRDRLQDEKERLKCGNAFRGKKRPEHSLKLVGRTLSEEVKEKMRKPKHSDHGAKVSTGLKGLQKSELHRAALSAARKNVPLKTCPHCGITMNASSYGRYHGDRCKLNPSVSKDIDSISP